MNKIYFDNSATTPLAEEVLSTLTESLKADFANPSSIHRLGKQVKKKIEEARKFIAESINAEPEEIIFLSGATEANNTIFKTQPCDLIISSPSEHASVIEAAKATNKEIIWLNLDKEGYISLTELEYLLKEHSHKKILVSIMHANSEIGTVQDIKAIGSLCRYYRASFHSDCVQSLGKLDIDVKASNLDFISASAHKIHGPKGIGFLYVNKSLHQRFLDNALIVGGSQEQGFRSGTENSNAIIAFMIALKLMLDPNRRKKIKTLQKQLWKKLKELHGCILNGPQDLNERLSGNLNLSFQSLKFTSEQLVLQLDLKGICVSSGSACTSNKKAFIDTSLNDPYIESSYVLRACRIDETIAKKAIRISLSWMNTEEELKKMIETMEKLV